MSSALLRGLCAAACVLLGLLLPAAAHAGPSAGVNIAGAPTPDRLDEAIATGATQVRIFAYWNEFERNGPGDFPTTAPGSLARVYGDAVDRLNAAGVTPQFVVLGTPAWANGSSGAFVPPADPAAYAAFLGEFAREMSRNGRRVAALEVWNEPDEHEFWKPGPDPDRYAALLKAGYAAVKAAAPQVTVITGATTGNNYAWIEGLYARGAKGSFDGVAVHTDTACLTAAPDGFYRENGRLGRFTFLGFREVRASMLARGVDKPIWMTELGWSSTGGVPNSCTRGAYAGQKPSGVTREQQAAYLSHAFRCMAHDPYVVLASWFTMRDAGTGSGELENYGLVDAGGAPKLSLAAFRAARVAGPGACGDFDPPSLSVTKPAQGQVFVDKLDLMASATDGGVGVGRVSYTFDGGKDIRSFTGDALKAPSVGLTPWQGSGSLPLGPHTVEVTAVDLNGNTTTRTVNVTKVAPGGLAATLLPTFRFARRTSQVVRCKRRACTLRGQLLRGKPGTPTILGKVAVEWQLKNKQGRWRKLVGGLKPAGKPFTFSAKLKQAGRWRVRVAYRGQAPWKRTASKYFAFRVR